MPTEPKQRITQWSYSRWRDYEHCPRLAKYKYIDRRKEPDSPAMARGTAVHKAAETWLNAPEKLPLPESLENFRMEFNGLRRLNASAELEWALTKEWEPTGWFDPNCWVRIKVDAYALKAGKIAQVVDFKTGKQRDSHEDQLSLYAIGALAHEPKALVANAELWYLDLGKKGGRSFARSSLTDLKAEWAGKTKALLSDTIHAPRPNESCRWCAFSKAKGGPCEF